MKILVVDDDSYIREALTRLLQKHGYLVLQASDAHQAERLLDVEKIDLILLDVMMPNETGIDFCKRMKPAFKVPIIMLTAIDDEIDQIICLELGVLDYITKPFNPRVLLAKIKNFLARVEDARKSDDHISFDGWSYSVSTQVLIDDRGEKQDLGYMEANVLMLLLKNTNKILSRDYILERVNRRQYQVDDRSVDILISRLRKRLKNHRTQFIKTVYGRGYIFQTKSVF